MKNLVTFLLLPLMMATTACRDKDKGETKPCNTNAALELYCKYADDDDLTVAYLGDFEINGKAIDAVMLQANEEDNWLRIRQDFGMVVENDSCEKAIDLPDCPNPPGKVVSVGIGIEADLLGSLGLDSLTTRDQITEEHIKLFSENVAMQIHNILSNFETSDSVMPAAAIVVGDGPIEYEGENINYDDYIHTVAEAIAANIIDEYFTQRDSIKEIVDTETYQKAMEEGDNMMTNARLHGHSGYITTADHANRTLWLFFYDDQEGCNVILTHIKDNIIIKQ